MVKNKVNIDQPKTPYGVWQRMHGRTCYPFTYPACYDHPEDHRDQSDVCEPGFTLEGHNEGKESCEEGSGGADHLVERYGEVSQGYIATNNREAEDGAQGCNLKKLGP